MAFELIGRKNCCKELSEKNLTRCGSGLAIEWGKVLKGASKRRRSGESVYVELGRCGVAEFLISCLIWRLLLIEPLRFHYSFLRGTAINEISELPNET